MACGEGDDRILLERYRAGDRKAGNELSAKLIPMVRRVVVRVLGPSRSMDWDDVCQESLLRVLAKLHLWRGDCPLVNWAAVVAARVAISSMRVRWPLPIASDDDILTSHSDRSTSPARAACLKDSLECLNRKLAEFDSNWQQVLKLHGEGVDHSEIGRCVGKSRRTIQYWLAKMYEQLMPCVDR